MLVGLGKGFSEEGIVLLDIGSIGRVKIFRLITGFRDSQSLPDPVDDRVGDVKPGKSENDISLAAAHDVEEMFLGDPFNVCVEGASIVDCTSFVYGLIYILDHNGESEFLGGELMFSDILPVNARDVSARVY